MSKDILPDSRLTHWEGKVVSGQNPARPDLGRLNYVPIFCAHCGTPKGYVPEEYCTFACFLCDDCAETYGPILGTYMMPDEVFWAEVKAHEEAKARRLLGNEQFERLLKGGT